MQDEAKNVAFKKDRKVTIKYKSIINFHNLKLTENRVEDFRYTLQEIVD